MCSRYFYSTETFPVRIFEFKSMSLKYTIIIKLYSPRFENLNILCIMNGQTLCNRSYYK